MKVLAGGSLGLVFVATALVVSSARSAVPDVVQTPRGMVAAALQAEAEGDLARRDALLDEAATRFPSYAPARWHRGEIKVGGKWTPAELASEEIGKEKLYQYREFRDAREDTLADQLVIANWCRERGLKQQERAHLMRVLQHNPGHYQARTRLGFRLIDGQWLSREMLKEQAEVAKEEKKAFGKYYADLDKWARQMRMEDPAIQQHGRERIVAIDDPAAIPVMEKRLSLDSVPVALAAVQSIGGMPQYEASVALARQAIFSPSSEVREHAATYLKSKKPESFVPPMLSSLSTPVTTRFQVTHTMDGHILYRHMFVREVQGAKQLLVTDRRYRRVSRQGGSVAETTTRAEGEARRALAQKEFEVAQQNAYTLELNNRICAALNTALDMEMPAEPDLWWTWWNARNEVYVAGEKPTEKLYEADYVSIADLPPPRRSYDCLAAGTLVTTIDGLRAVDKLQQGDLVLSQDPNSGELAYRAVVETTIRPSGETIRVICDGETLETSGGHLFWVSGRGWVKTRELLEGMQLHTSSGTIQVKRLESASVQKTYNLVVDGFHTFFVGSERILNHDNTVSEPTNSVVPGLSVGTAQQAFQE